MSIQQLKTVFVAFVVVASLMACKTSPKTSEPAPSERQMPPAISAPGSIQVLPPTDFNQGTVIDQYNAIVGNKGSEIDPKDVKVEFPSGVYFTDTMADQIDVSPWITNLPAGLTGRLHEAKGGENGAKEFRIYVSGIPTETRKEPVRVTIPGGFLNTGAPAVIEVNKDAIFDIAEGILSVGDGAETAAWTRSSKTVSINGSVGSPIQPRTLTIRLDKAAVAERIKERTDLSEWITNLPAGLTALSGETEQGAVEVVLTISGTPAAAIDQAVFVQIPLAYLEQRSDDLFVVPNEDIRFEIYNINIRNVIVYGEMRSPIKPTDVSVNFGDAKLLSDIAKGADLSRWFTNLPSGLRALAADAVAAGAQEVTVTMNGTPAARVSAPIRVRVPADIIFQGKAFDVALNNRARYDVGTFDIVSQQRDQDSSLNERVMSEQWALNNPKLVETKNFDAVGIIQITSVMTQDIGRHSEYIWTGETVTYGKLMAEARRLNAHAIINIVIDYSDDINEKIGRRRVDAAYQLSEEQQQENSKIPNRYSLERNPDDTMDLVERTRQTVRTYTGTALAIRYTNDNPPVEPVAEKKQ